MNRFAAVHQFHSGTAVGDAITAQMLQLQSEIRAFGYESEIFAEHVAPGLSGRIRSIDTYQGSEQNLLLVHHSLGYGIFDDVIAVPDEIVAVYHNVTPERYFSDESFRRLIRLGREQLSLLARRARHSIADSNYNRREMLAAGFRRVDVLPVRVHFSQFAPPSTSHVYRSSDWLFVGRVVGNKCQHDVVRAFAEYATAFDDEARLLLIGDTSFEDYVQFVRREAERLGVHDRVVLFGSVSESQLKAAYWGAGVFVSLSEHEGFGVPILEAMAAGLPVLAFGAAAVPETMGGAGILLRSKDPAVVAATAQAIRLDPGLRGRLEARQRIRVKKVEAFDVRGFLSGVIARAAGESRPLEIQVQGPFESSYSLAIANRKLATQLATHTDRSLSIYATEGPGDYEPDPAAVDRDPESAKLFRRSSGIQYPDLVIRQMYPPRVIDSPGAITCEYFGWEESLLPQNMVDDFNRYLNGVGVMSSFVRDVLRDSGVDVPVRVVGVGVDPHDENATTTLPELDSLRSFRFLNIGSAFPRKGLDVLLEAYFSTFDGSSDVTLILKTFPNQHNRVAAQLDDLRSRYPHPPDVRWIDRDLAGREVSALYNMSDCYVHPARGEGFGLPVAEAMAAGVPVISLAYSGLAEFVSERTAVTIPYRIEAARTHFNIPGSVWAEPDGQRLALAMRRMAEQRDSAAISAKVEEARHLVLTKFSWEAVAARWDDFIADLEDGAERLGVAMVSTWNSRCGIAENTARIVELAGNVVDFELFADTASEVVDPSRDVGVVRAWADRWHPDLSELERRLRVSSAQVIHIQFNFGFFELTRLADFIECQLDQRGVVMTLHRTRDIEIDGNLISLGSIKTTLARLDRIIVHQTEDAETLSRFGLVENVSVVPIGTSPPPAVSHSEAREALGLGKRPVIGTFGFLLPHKGTLDLVRAVDSLRLEFPEICLLAFCARYPNPQSLEYEEEIRAEIKDRDMNDNVLFVTDYLADEVVGAALRGVDAIVLPYHHTEESSSAALRFVLPLERPLVVTDQPIFHDCLDAVLAVDPSDTLYLESALRRVLTDADLSDELQGRARLAARRFRWSLAVADHREIYGAARRSHRMRTAADNRTNAQT